MSMRIGPPIATANVQNHDAAVAEHSTPPLATIHSAPAHLTLGRANPPSLKTRLAGKLSGRQSIFTAGIPGTGRTINRPLRADLPGAGEEAAAGSDEDHDALLAQAHGLNALSQSMLKSQEPSQVSVWERPAPSATRRLTTKVLPWLKPAPLRDIASTQSNGRPPQAASLASDTPSPESIAGAAKELLGLVDHRRRDLDTAITALVDARAHLDTLEYAVSTAPLAPTTRPGQEFVASLRQQIANARIRLKTADTATRSASQRLREVLQGTDMLHLKTFSENHDQVGQRAEFSRQWLTDLKTNLQTVDVRFADRHTAIKLELELKTEQTRELISLDHDTLVAERAQLAAEAHIKALSAQVDGALADSPARTALNSEIDQAQGDLNKSRDDQKRIAQRLAQINTDCAQLNDDIGALHTRLAAETRKRQAATSAPVLQAIDEQLQRSAPPANATGTTDERADRAAIDEIQKRYMSHQIDTAQAFATPGVRTEGINKLQAALRPIGERLSGATPATPMPAFAVMEMITSALADVTDKDPKRAADVLEALNGQPPRHWPGIAEGLAQSPQAALTPDSATAQDVVEVCRKLASIPRGIELLQVLSGEGTAPATPAETHALRVFWNADKAQQDNPIGEVKAWLQTAKKVAQAKLANEDTAFDDVDHAAFNAVRNGYVSNATGSLYDQHDRRLKKATVEWVMRAVATKSSKSGDNTEQQKASTARRLAPNLNKTPFGKSGLSKSYDVGESMGMKSPRREVDQAVARRLRQLEATIEACRALPERRQDAAAAQAMVSHLRSLEKRGEHLSQVVLQGRDIKAMRTRVTASAHEQRLVNKAAAPQGSGSRRQPNVLMKAQPIELPDLYAQLSTGELSAYEGINRIEEQLREGLPPAHQPALDDTGDEDLGAAMRLLKSQHLSEKSDIVAFFKPFILESRLRDRLRLGGGGTLGGGLPSLPYGFISPIVSPIFSAETSRTDEAFAQLFMPILGLEMSFGKARTTAWEATAGVAVGPELAPGVAVQGAFTSRFSSQQTQTSSTLMRFFRTRHKDDEMRNNMLNALDSMVAGMASNLNRAASTRARWKPYSLVMRRSRSAKWTAPRTPARSLHG